MTGFPIRPVDRNLRESVEPLGSKPKFWFQEDGRRLLFKADVRGTGEDWAELIACHLCQLLKLPHVEYELAVECDGTTPLRPGVICENMAQSPLSLVLGNQLLLELDPDYPTEQRFRVRQHTVDAVREVMTRLEFPDSEWMPEAIPGVQTAADVFAGYLMLDAWIANQDRHHGNWGAIWDGRVLRLAPTFDHGSSLARNLLDSEREDRLSTRDRRRTVASFAERGRSALFGLPTDQRPLGLHAAFLAFAEQVPIAANAWRDRLRNVSGDQIRGIVDQVPPERIHPGVAADESTSSAAIESQR
jgi:hypothetical protein